MVWHKNVWLDNVYCMDKADASVCVEKTKRCKWGLIECLNVYERNNVHMQDYKNSW